MADYSKKYVKNRRKNDSVFKLKHGLRTRINHAIKGNSKSESTMILIGCSVDYLMYHLQKKFIKGMTWDNHNRGGWVIDHIKPCASFDLSKPEE